MKRCSILFLLSLTFSGMLQGQIIEKGNVELNLGVGFGIYGIATNDYEDNSNVGIPGLVSGGISYYIGNKFGLGLNFERNGFITDPDSNVTAISMNYSLRFLYNVLNSEKDAISLALDLGASNFEYENFKNEDYVISNGANLKLGAMWRHYFTDNLGFYLKMNLASYSYDRFENKEGEVLQVFKPTNNIFIVESRQYEMAMVGVNIGFGLTYKF